MNGREVGTSDSTTYQKELGPLAPGQYTFTATVKDSTGEPVITEEYRLLEEENYISSIPLDFKRMNFVGKAICQTQIFILMIGKLVR